MQTRMFIIAGCPVLILAIALEFLELAILLLQKAVDPSIVDPSLDPALFYASSAAEGGATELVNLIMSKYGNDFDSEPTRLRR